MPIVVAIRQLETCLDSSHVMQFELDGVLDEACMERTAVQGKLAYFPDFPRPYFCVRRSGWYVVQGILGDSWLRVTFLPNSHPQAQAFLVAAIAGAGSNPIDQETEVFQTPSGCYPIATICAGSSERR
jgi:hypothetical protein